MTDPRRYPENQDKLTPGAGVAVWASLVGKTIARVVLQTDLDPADSATGADDAAADALAAIIETTDGTRARISTNGSFMEVRHPAGADEKDSNLTYVFEPGAGRSKVAQATDCTCVGYEGEDPRCKIHNPQEKKGGTDESD